MGAERWLRETIKGFDNEKLKEFCAEKGVEWHFISPLSPHQNGCAESLVKSVKCAMKICTLNDSRLTIMEFR